MTDRTRRVAEQTKQRIVELFLHGDTQGNAPGSKWAAVNAIVEYGDWHRPIRQGGERFARAIDDGADKTRALEADHRRVNGPGEGPAGVVRRPRCRGMSFSRLGGGQPPQRAAPGAAGQAFERPPS